MWDRMKAWDAPQQLSLQVCYDAFTAGETALHILTTSSLSCARKIQNCPSAAQQIFRNPQKLRTSR